MDKPKRIRDILRPAPSKGWPSAELSMLLLALVSKCIKLADRSEELKFLLPDIRRANSSGQSDKASNAQKHATASLVAASDSYQSFKGQSNMLQCNPIHGVSLMALGIVTDCLAASCCCECCCQSSKVPNVGAHCLIPVVSSSWSNASCMLLVLTP